jgi:hypothetical protein
MRGTAITTRGRSCRRCWRRVGTAWAARRTIVRVRGDIDAGSIPNIIAARRVDSTHTRLAGGAFAARLFTPQATIAEGSAGAALAALVRRLGRALLVPHIGATGGIDGANAGLAELLVTSQRVVRHAAVRHVAKATRRALHIGLVNAAFIPLVGATAGIDTADAVLARLNVATEAEIWSTTVSRHLANAVDRALVERFIRATLVPAIDAALIVEPTNAVLTAHVVATQPLMAGAAIARVVADAIGRTLSPRLVHTSLIPSILTAFGIKIANTGLTT